MGRLAHSGDEAVVAIGSKSRCPLRHRDRAPSSRTVPVTTALAEPSHSHGRAPCPLRESRAVQPPSRPSCLESSRSRVTRYPQHPRQVPLERPRQGTKRLPWPPRTPPPRSLPDRLVLLRRVE